jgi:hypothetical protein
MEPNSSADNARQSRGLARFWPGHAAGQPERPDSDEDDATMIEQPPRAQESHSGSAQAAAAAHLAKNQPDTQMVALGSRGNAFPPRPWDDNQGGFPPVDSERAQQNGDAPRHGGAPIPNGSAPMPQPRPAFGTAAAFPGAPASPFAPQAPQQSQAPQPPQAPRPPQAPPPIPQQPQPPAASAAPPVPAPSSASAASPASPAKADERKEAPEDEIRAIPLGGTTSGRRRSSDEADEAKTEEPGNNGKAAGWATVPTSGIPSLAKQPVPAAGRRATDLEDADSLPRAGRSEDKPASSGPLKPGDVQISQIAFWDEEAITHFRKQWHEVKADFVDDPVAALTRAHDLLTEAVNELTEALLAERDELDPLDGKATPDTESMRMAMRGYRDFLDRILAL